LKTVRLLATVSRPEFIPANSASLIIGVAWGINLPAADLVWELLIPVALVYAVISLVAAVAAQINTMADYELDLKDSSKKELVKAMKSVGQSKVKGLIIVELLLSLIFIVLLWQIRGKPALLLMWAAAVFLAYAYSAKPLRLKSRSWLAVLTLLIVLSILPVGFVYYTFTSELGLLFLIFLSGQALTVYGVIVPAEIRDYFNDKTMGLQTMTVQLGLVKASLFSILLLSVGGFLAGTGFLLKLVYGAHQILIVFLLVMAIVYGFVLRKYSRLYSLSKKHLTSKDSDSVAQEIEKLAAQNPRWITLVTQSIVLMSIVLLVSKFLS
jgi:4-hydroxybenzoate polyprenyltransferase